MFSLTSLLARRKKKNKSFSHADFWIIIIRNFSCNVDRTYQFIVNQVTRSKFPSS